MSPFSGLPTTLGKFLIKTDHYSIFPRLTKLSLAHWADNRGVYYEIELRTGWWREAFHFGPRFHPQYFCSQIIYNQGYRDKYLILIGFRKSRGSCQTWQAVARKRAVARLETLYWQRQLPELQKKSLVHFCRLSGRRVNSDRPNMTKLFSSEHRTSSDQSRIFLCNWYTGGQNVWVDRPFY